jgi:hypothetical protein
MVANESSRHAAGAGGGVSPTTLEQVLAGVEELAVRYAATPPLLMLEQARRARDTAYYALDRTHRPAQAADLYLAAGQLCGLMARASFDLGAWSAAEEQARAACVYAELVDHPGLHAWARRTLAMIAYWARFPRQAITQVEAGLDGAPEGAARARLHAVEARAWAHVGGDLGRVTAALAAGEQALSAGDGDADRYVGVGGEFAWGPAAHMACASTALLTAGDPAGAARQARTALDLISEGGGTDAVVAERVQVDLASAELAAGHLDAAGEALAPVWSVAVEQRRQAMTGRLAQLAGALVGSTWRGEPEAAQLRDRIEVFCTEARPRALPAG